MWFKTSTAGGVLLGLTPFLPGSTSAATGYGEATVLQIASNGHLQGYGTCTGDATVDLRGRPEGVRLKMWYRHNSLKIYDKAGQALRVETTINQPKDFRVYRTPEGAPEGTAPSWQQMRKGVADLRRRGEVSDRGRAPRSR